MLQENWVSLDETVNCSTSYTCLLIPTSARRKWGQLGMKELTAQHLTLYFCFISHFREMGDQSKPPLIPDDEADDDSNDEEENGDDAGTPTQAAEGASQLMEELSVQEKGEENSTAGAAAVESGVGSDVGDDDGDEDEGAAEGEEASERPGPGLETFNWCGPAFRLISVTS